MKSSEIVTAKGGFKESPEYHGSPLPWLGQRWRIFAVMDCWRCLRRCWKWILWPSTTKVCLKCSHLCLLTQLRFRYSTFKLKVDITRDISFYVGIVPTLLCYFTCGSKHCTQSSPYAVSVFLPFFIVMAFLNAVFWIPIERLDYRGWLFGRMCVSSIFSGFRRVPFECVIH